MNDPVVIVGAARTPMGALQGELKEFTAAELGAVAIRAAAERAGIGFVPLAHERYELIIPEDRINDERVQRLVTRLTQPSFEAEVRRLGGYSTEQTGSERRISR